VGLLKRHICTMLCEYCVMQVDCSDWNNRLVQVFMSTVASQSRHAKDGHLTKMIVRSSPTVQVAKIRISCRSVSSETDGHMKARVQCMWVVTKGVVIAGRCPRNRLAQCVSSSVFSRYLPSIAGK
jgi:hypothetical protein